MPTLSPAGHSMREYVAAAELAVLIESYLEQQPPGTGGISGLATRAGVSDRAVVKVVREQDEWPWVGVLMADALLLAMDHSLLDVETVWRRVKSPNGSAPARLAA